MDQFVNALTSTGGINATTVSSSLMTVLPVLSVFFGIVLVYGLVRKPVQTFANKRKFKM